LSASSVVIRREMNKLFTLHFHTRDLERDNDFCVTRVPCKCAHVFGDVIFSFRNI
jgi:hypothetical protein